MTKLLPIGITPKNVWELEMKHQRMNNLLYAIMRYKNDDVEIPMEWIHEYLELIFELEHGGIDNE